MAWNGPSAPVFVSLGATPKMRMPDKAKGVVFKLRASDCEGVSDHLPKMS